MQVNRQIPILDLVINHVIARLAGSHFREKLREGTSRKKQNAVENMK